MRVLPQVALLGKGIVCSVMIILDELRLGDYQLGFVCEMYSLHDACCRFQDFKFPGNK